MASVLLFLGVLLTATTAFGLEVFTAATANQWSDPIGYKDYGGPQQTGGSIVAVGAHWPEASVWGLPLELRLQRVIQTTAWNDNREPGETQYRDGYQVDASEALVGYRWAYDPQFSFALQFGGGMSQIKYKTRENHDDGSTSEFTTQARHQTSQLDLRYELPCDLKNVSFGLAGMLRISVLESHPDYDEVPIASWYLNIPTIPLPSTGLWIGVKL